MILRAMPPVLPMQFQKLKHNQQSALRWRHKKESLSKSEQLSNIAIYCLLIVFLLPDYIYDLNDITSIIFDATRAFGCLVAVILLLINRRSSDTAKAVVAYIIFIGIVTACSFSSARIIRLIAIYADIFAIVVFSDFLISRNSRLFLKVMHALLLAGLALNTISVVACPDGLLQVANEAGVYGAYYLYGYDNEFILLYLPTVAVVFLYERFVKKKERGGIETLITLIVCTASLAYLESAAATISFIFATLLYVLFRKSKRQYKLIDISWVIYCVLAILLVSGVLLSQDSPFVSLIGKGSSLLRREMMWSAAIEMIASNPIFGTGILSSGEMREFFGFATLHNTLLNLVFWSGILGLLLFSGMIFSMQRELTLTASCYDANILSYLFVAYLLGSFTGCLELGSAIYLLFMIIGNYGTIKENGSRRT